MLDNYTSAARTGGSGETGAGSFGGTLLSSVAQKCHKWVLVFSNIGKATEEGAGTINGDCVELLQDLNKLLSVLLSNKLNSKIVEENRECDVLCWCVSRDRECVSQGPSQIWKGGV